MDALDHAHARDHLDRLAAVAGEHAADDPAGADTLIELGALEALFAGLPGADELAAAARDHRARLRARLDARLAS